MQRVGVLVELPRMVRQMGGDPEKVLRDADVYPTMLADADGFISFRKACELTALAAEHTGCDEFSILLAAQTRIEHLGPLARYMRAAPNLRAALHDIVTYHPSYARGGGPYLMERQGGGLLIGYRTHSPGVRGASHFARGAVTFGYRIFQEIGGLPPSRLLISLPPPADLSHYRSVFGNLRIEFEAAHFGLVYGPAALSAPLPQADIGLRQAMGSALAERWNALHPNLRDRVLRVLVPAVLSGSQSLETTAARLGMGPEVLTRELRRLGSSFRDLVNEARFEIACQLLVDAKLSISALSAIFGYSEVSAFTRFFTSMSGGVPPAEWRRTLSEATV